MGRGAIAIWVSVVVVGITPIVIAGMSPLLEWRNWIYIAAGFGGVVALSILLLQPILAAGIFPDLSLARGRRIHRWTGAILVACVAVHVIGLWITSPPDVIDALLFVSATPFSIWGVIAMWSVVISALLAVIRHKLYVSTLLWRNSHRTLAIITVAGSVAHAMMIEGTMGTTSKTALCVLMIVATAIAVSPRLTRRLNALIRSVK